MTDDNNATPTVAHGEYEGLIKRLLARVRIARMWRDGQIADDTLEEFAANLAEVEGAAADALAALQADAARWRGNHDVQYEQLTAAQARIAALETALKEIVWQNHPGSEWCRDRARAALAKGEK